MKDVTKPGAKGRHGWRNVSKPGAKGRHGWRMYLSLEPREDMVEDVSKPGAKDMGGGCT